MTAPDDSGAAFLALAGAAARGDARLARQFADRDGDDPSLAEMDAVDGLIKSARAVRQALLDAGEPVPELSPDVLKVIGPPFDPAERCQMYCERPIGPDGTQGRDGGKAMCPDCEQALYFLAHEVLPAIRRHGYWAPSGSSVEQEFAAMVGQDGAGERMRASMAALFGDDVAAALFGGGS